MGVGEIKHIYKATIVLFLLVRINAFPLKNRECPAAIDDTLDGCKCRYFAGSVMTECHLVGKAYDKLPSFGDVNMTVQRTTLTGGRIGMLSNRTFAKLKVRFFC